MQTIPSYTGDKIYMNIYLSIYTPLYGMGLWWGSGLKAGNTGLWPQTYSRTCLCPGTPRSPSVRVPFYRVWSETLRRHPKLLPELTRMSQSCILTNFLFAKWPPKSNRKSMENHTWSKCTPPTRNQCFCSPKPPKNHQQNCKKRTLKTIPPKSSIFKVWTPLDGNYDSNGSQIAPKLTPILHKMGGWLLPGNRLGPPWSSICAPSGSRGLQRVIFCQIGMIFGRFF